MVDCFPFVDDMDSLLVSRYEIKTYFSDGVYLCKTFLWSNPIFYMLYIMVTSKCIDTLYNTHAYNIQFQSHPINSNTLKFAVFNSDSFEFETIYITQFDLIVINSPSAATFLCTYIRALKFFVSESALLRDFQLKKFRIICHFDCTNCLTIRSERSKASIMIIK